MSHLVQLTPPLIEAFDRFIADTMEVHDLVYELAQRALALPDEGSGSMQSVPLPVRPKPPKRVL
jgi:hypothetical protein